MKFTTQLGRTAALTALVLVASLGLSQAVIPPSHTFILEGTNNYILGQGLQPPISNQTGNGNQSDREEASGPRKFFQNIYDEGQKHITLNEIHTFTLKYSGSYKSAPVSQELWQLKYDLNILCKFNEALTFKISDFYEYKIIFDLNLIDVTLSLPSVKFVHPQALYRNHVMRQSNASIPQLPFDMKLEANYAITQLLQTNIELKDSMLGSFTKDISEMAKGLAIFAFD